jgi:hypothetical protein
MDEYETPVKGSVHAPYQRTPYQRTLGSQPLNRRNLQHLLSFKLGYLHSLV